MVRVELARIEERLPSVYVDWFQTRDCPALFNQIWAQVELSFVTCFKMVNFNDSSPIEVLEVFKYLFIIDVDIDLVHFLDHI